jgi:hypothetical protein
VQNRGVGSGKRLERLHLAAFDEVGIELKNRIELLDRWNLLAAKHTAARLIDHTGSQATKVLDLLARLRDRQIGNQIFAARFAGPSERRSCTTSSTMPISSRYVPV